MPHSHATMEGMPYQQHQQQQQQQRQDLNDMFRAAYPPQDQQQQWQQHGQQQQQQQQAPPQYGTDGTGPVPPPDLQPSDVRLVVPSGQQLAADNSGRLEVHSRPGWAMRCFMCPFPFFCLGCCLSQSSDVLFDDRAATITINSWPGYCSCCAGAPIIVPYSDVANVTAISGNMSINRQPAYNIVLVTKSGGRHRISDPDLLSEHAPQLLAYHRFLFGRANPSAYVPPSIYSLLLSY